METITTQGAIDLKPSLELGKIICRCCLCTDKQLTNINEYRGHFIELAGLLTTESDGLPQWICWECRSILLKSVRFKQKILRAQNVLYEYHNRCAPFPVDIQDPELKNYESPILSTTNILITDTVTEDYKDGFRDDLQHTKVITENKLEELHFNDTEIDFNDDGSMIKEETHFSDYELALEDLSISHVKELDDIPVTEIKQEKRSKKKKVKKKVRKEKTSDEELENMLETKPRKIRQRIDIDESKIRIVMLDPVEQFKQRELECKKQKYPTHCHLCFKGFNFEEKLQNHMAKHQPSRGPHKCDLCTMYFPTVYSLGVHNYVHTRRFECKRCGVRMVDRGAMISHYRMVHEGIVSLVTCHICGKVSHNEKTHKGHMRNHHMNLRASCDQCGKSFVNRDSLAEHTLIHKNVKNYECEQCGKRFRTRTQITHHMRMHSDVRDYYCVECDKRFKSEATMRKHFTSTSKHCDKKVMKYPCTICGKRYRNEKAVRAHAAIQHEGLRPHSCAQCGVALATRASLRKHELAVHGNVRAMPTHVCHTCGKMFRARSTLVNHVRTHTGEKPFACDTCGRAFAQRSAMRTHVKLMHLKVNRNKEKQPTPTVCVVTTKEEALSFEWRSGPGPEYFPLAAP